MAQIPNLQSTNTLGTDDQAILRQGTIDKRISLNLAGILSWAGREGYNYIGEHTTGSQFPDTKSFTTYQGRTYFVNEGVTLTYTSPTNDPTADNNLYVKSEDSIKTSLYNTINNNNLLFNHNFFIPSSLVVTTTPQDVVAGVEIFKGVFTGASGVQGLALDSEGRPFFTGGGLYFPVPNSQGNEKIPTDNLVASVADFDGKPRTRGVSFGLVDGEYRVSITVDALEDENSSATPLGSVKLEQGVFATKHEIKSLFDIYGHPNMGIFSANAFGANTSTVSSQAIQDAINAAAETNTRQVVTFVPDTYSATNLRTTALVELDLRGVTLQKPSDASYSDTYILTLVNTSDEAIFRLQGGVLDGNDNGQSFYHLLRLENENCDVIIDGMEFINNNVLSGGSRVQGTETDGILVTRAKSFTFINSKIDNVCRNGISFIDGNCKRVTIDNNLFDNCGLTGVDFEPNTTIANQFEYITTTNNKFVRCWDVAVWPNYLGGAYTILNKPSDTYTLCDTHIFKDNIVDCTHDDLAGNLLLGMRAEGVRRSVVSGNKFFNCKLLSGAAANVNLEGIDIAHNEFVNVDIEVYRTKTISTLNNLVRNNLSKIILQADPSSSDGIITMSNDDFRNAGTAGLDRLIRAKANKVIDISGLQCIDSRLTADLPLSFIGVTSPSVKLSLSNMAVSVKYQDFVSKDTSAALISVNDITVDGAVNFAKELTSIDGIKAYSSRFYLDGDFIVDIDGGTSSGIVVTDCEISSVVGIASEVINNSTITSNKFSCSSQAISSYSDTTSANNTFIRDNSIINTVNTPIDFLGDESSFVGNNWTYNCAALTSFGVSDAGGNIERAVRP